MKRVPILLAGLLVPAMLLAQLNEVWVGTHSGPCAWTTDDFGQRVACDADGNVYVCWGGQGLTGSTDYITVKYGPDGSTRWTRYYDGPDEGADEANAIAVDASGAVYVAGFCTKSGSDYDYATIKYDSDGNLLWDSHYDGGHGSDVARAIVWSGNVVYVTGSSNGSGTGSDYTTIAYNTSDGTPAWSGSGVDEHGAARYDGGYGLDDYASAIAVDAASAVYVTGYSISENYDYDYATVKYDADGALGWQSLPGGAARYDGGYGYDYASAVAVDAAGAVHVTGTSGGASDNDWATIKYNPSTGEATRLLRYEGSGNAFANAIAVDASGAVYVTGSSSGAYSDYTTIKYNADGSEGWAGPARYDGPDHGYDDAYAITVNSSGVFVTGFSGGSDWTDDYATVWYDANDGAELGAARYAGPDGSYDISLSIASASAGDVYVTGYSTDYDQFENIVTIGYHGEQQSVKPAAFNLSTPAKDATGVLTEGDLTWEASAGADYYVVTLDGVDHEVTPNSCHYQGLGYATPYTWNVAAHNSAGTTPSSNGPFVFTTIVEAPAPFNLVSPADAAENYEISGTLTWDASARAISYDVYLGTDPDALPCVSAGQEELTWNFSGLACNGTHFWKVIARSAGGGETPSAVWSFTTGSVDAGVSTILEPSGLIDILTETPKATVCNFGTLARDVTAWFEIRDSATNTIQYDQSVTVTGLAGGAQYDAEFPSWDVPDVEGRYYSRAWTELADDIDPSNDQATGMFAVESAQQQPANWASRPGVPAGSDRREVKDGAAMATDPDGLYAFLLKGNNTSEFYRYDPATELWGTLDPIPEQGRNNVPRSVKDGGTLAQVNGRFYATKGGNSLEFWEYNPAAAPGSRWTQKADVPAGAAKVHSGASAAGVCINGNGYVYLLKASGTFEYYRYDAAADAWTAMANAPGLPGEEFGNGSSISFDGTDTVFALKGTLNKFYAYVVSANTWLARPDLPLGPKNKQAKGGAAICYHLRNVYCMKGSNSQEFWVFDCDNGAWTQSWDVPLGPRQSRVQDGGALVYCRDSRYLFATKGGSTLEFWSYGRLSNYGAQSPEQEPVELSGRLTPYRLDVTPTVVTGHAGIAFALPAAGNVELSLYDAAGRLARTLVSSRSEAGMHTVPLAASELARGVYILKYRSGEYQTARKLIIE